MEKKKADQRKSITIRCTEEERTAIHEKADATGISINEYILKASLGVEIKDRKLRQDVARFLIRSQLIENRLKAYGADEYEEFHEERLKLWQSIS